VEPAEGNSYFKVDNKTGEFRVTNREGLLRSSVTNYKIKLFLKDSNGITSSNQTYIVNFDLNTKVPHWKRMKISNYGKVKISFSEDIIIPTNATFKVNSAVLKL
jgi:hypothetical protein